jgi:hypothetical protein
MKGKLFYHKATFPILTFSILILFSLLFIKCNRGLDKEPLSLTVKQNLALLQADPQFVMYFNFRKMRETDFWNKFISDSLFNSERNFGNFLYTLKKATGVSISSGIDELYFSNSWIGDNAIVIKGTFDRKKIDEYVKTDTVYNIIIHERGFKIYNDVEKHFYFYFKDEFTVCASNYLPQMERTYDLKDTTNAGLLTNTDAMNAIENIKYKENLWMMSNQKLFIRGIFENLFEMKKPKQGMDSTLQQDTTSILNVQSIYGKIKAVSFSLKMTDDVHLIMQNECEDEKSANELKNKTDGVISLIKITSELSKKRPASVIKLLDKLKLSQYNNTFLIEALLNESDITEIRKQKVF